MAAITRRSALKNLSFFSALSTSSLMRGSQSAEIELRPRSLVGIEDVVETVAFSGDGTRVAAGFYNGTLSIWDAWTGAPIRTITKSGGPVVAAALNSDGSRLAVSAWLKIQRSIRPESGRLGVGQGSIPLSFRGNKLSIWSIRSGKVIRTLVKDEADARSMIKAIAFDKDNEQLSALNAIDLFTAWDTATGKRVLYMAKACLAGDPPDIVSVTAFDGTGLRAAAVDRSRGPAGKVKVWDAFGASVRTYNCSADAITLLALSRDGRRLATGTRDHRISVWDFGTGRRICRCAWNDAGPAASLIFGRGGRLVVSGGHDGTIRIWDARDGRMLQSIEGQSKCRVRQMVFLRGGIRAALGGQHRTPEERDQRTGRLKIEPLILWDVELKPNLVDE